MKELVSTHPQADSQYQIIIDKYFCCWMRAGMIQSLFAFVYDALCCRLKMGKYGHQDSYDEAVKRLPVMSLPTEVPAAPLLDSAEEQDAQDGFPLQNSGYR